jgi:hypothetical protein
VTAGYRDPSSPATFAIAALAANAALKAIEAVFRVLEYRLVADLAAGRVRLSAIVRSDDRIRVVAVLELITFAIAMVLFLMWFHRCYTNLAALGSGRRYSPGWSVGYWFVPVLNLVRPKQMADEMWVASDPQFSGSASVPGFVHAWWGCWILGNVLAFGAIQVRNVEHPSLDTVKTSSLVLAASAALTVVATILAIQVVRGITARQEQRARP